MPPILTPNPTAAGVWLINLEYGEGSLRNEMVRIRAGKFGRNPDESTREVENEAGTATIAALAMTQSNPLEMETSLDRCRWDKIDEMAVGHFFDMEFMRAYRVETPDSGTPCYVQ